MDISPSTTIIGPKILSLLEMFINCDITSLDDEYMVIDQILEKYISYYAQYYDTISAHARAKKSAICDTFIGNNKAIFQELVTPIIESFQQWCYSSPVAFGFAPLAQLAYGDNCKDILHFVSEKNRDGPQLSSAKWNKYLGMYVGKCTLRFQSLFKFGIGIRKTPDLLSFAFQDLQSFFINEQDKIIDSKISLYHGVELKLDYIRAWQHFFKEMHEKLTNNQSYACQCQKMLNFDV